jgi:Skp family chaperone for outer membrane proteins
MVAFLPGESRPFNTGSMFSRQLEGACMKPVAAGLFALSLLAPALQTVGGQRPTSSVAYLSVQKILTDSTDAKVAKQRLTELGQAKAQELAVKQKALEATKLELANSGGLFSATKRNKLKAQEAQQQSELQRLAQQAQSDVQNLQRQLEADLRREFSTIVGEIAARRSIQLVLNLDNAVVWTSTGTDLTAEVLDRLNAATQKRTGK